MMKRIRAYCKKHGAGYTMKRAAEIALEKMLHVGHRAYLAQRADETELSRQRAHQPQAGLISVVVPLYNTRPAFLRDLTESLLAQTYRNWEAVLLDGGSTSAETAHALAAIPADPRLRVIRSEQNAGISGNTNRAVTYANGAYIAFCDHDDVLAPDALWRMAEAIEREGPDLLYSDEDKLTEDGRWHTDPHRKPDFCPDNLRSGNYICHLTVMKRSLFEHLGGLRSAFDGSQDHDLMLRVSEVTDKICHVPHILYHWRTVASSASHTHLERCLAAAANAVGEHMARIGHPGRCSVEDGVLRLQYDVTENVTVDTIRVPLRERYAFMNRAAAASTADLLFFVGEEVEGLNEGFTEELMGYACRSDVGAVTPMLTDTRGRVTHAGFRLHKGLPVSRNRGLPAHSGGWHAMNRTSHNVLAVSACCVMIRRDHFIPFEESCADGLGAVDWCLRLRNLGLRHVYTPHARAVCTNKPMLMQWQCSDWFLGKWAAVRDDTAGENS